MSIILYFFTYTCSWQQKLFKECTLGIDLSPVGLLSINVIVLHGLIYEIKYLNRIEY